MSGYSRRSRRTSRRRFKGRGKRRSSKFYRISRGGIRL